MRTQTTFLLACLAGLAAHPAEGQEASFEVVPLVGVLLPSGDLARGTLTEAGGATTDIAVDQKSGVLLGVRVGSWWSRVFGWEASFGYALGEVDARADSGAGGQSLCGPEFDCGGDVWTFNSRIRARWPPDPGSRWYLYGAAGLAVVGHLGDVWERGQATTDLGGVLGIGAALDLSDRFGLRLDVEDYLYTYKPRIEDDPEVGTLDGEARTQNDVVISLGLTARLFGR